MVTRKIIRTFLVTLAFFCVFQLGRIQEKTAYLGYIKECVKVPDNIDMKTFYGHDFKDSSHLFNHAIAYNANRYINCIMKDFRHENIVHWRSAPKNK